MFLSKIQAGSSNDRSVYGDFWFSPLSGNTASGIRVTPDRAMMLPVVLACVRVLAESRAVLPARLYRTSGKTRTRVRKHWLLDLLKRPNPYQTGFEWAEMMQAHLALRGNAYNEVQTDRRGNIIAFMPLHPDRMQTERTGSGDFDFRYVYTRQDGSVVKFARDEIWHLRGLSSDGVRGMSILALARESIGMGLSAQDYGARFFQNDAKPGMWVEVPSNFKDKQQKEQFRESLQEAQTGINRHKVAVLEYGMKLHELGITNTDAQFLEARQFQVSDVARMFRVPPHLVGDLSKATFSNIEQQSLDFVVHTMTPWAERWESSIEVNVLSVDDDDLEVEFDFRNMLRGDQVARSTYYHNGILDGWMMRSEAREAEGLEEKEGLDRPLMPLNMTTIDENGDPQQSKPDSPPPKPADTQQEGRMQALLHGNARRMARRLAAGDPPSIGILAEALGVSLVSASEALKLTGNQEEITTSLLELAK